LTATIIDTSAILALLDERYLDHSAIAAIITAASGPLVVSPMVIAEADHMLQDRLGAAAARRFAADVVSDAYELAEWGVSDHAAALNIVSQFGDDKDYVGIADASNVVLADRYRTTEILTLDQRHFRRLSLLWGADHFTLVPYDA
jgi:uncharacterized protein